jgi:glycosyltransferase involved in cell wall biosynthesis
LGGRGHRGGELSKPRVLFVSRERHVLPLGPEQARKWGALSELLDVRVLAAAREPQPDVDARFVLVAPATPEQLDGAAFYATLPWRVAAELRSFRPDAVLVQGVHEAVAVLVGTRLARYRPRLVLDVQGDWREATRLYGSPLRRLLNPVNDRLAPLAVRGADAVRTVSQQTTELVRALGVEPAARFPAYVDAEAFLERPPVPLPERPRAVFVGAFERVKGLDSLLAAWEIAAPRVPGASLHAVGSGALQVLVESAQVEWSPRLEPEQVATAMDAAWVVALPSRSEGLPRVALEACCRGRAVVGGNRAGMPEVVRDGENGLLVDPDDAPGLADALVRVLAHRALAERLGAAARRTGEAWGVTPREYAAKIAKLVAPSEAK